MRSRPMVYCSTMSGASSCARIAFWLAFQSTDRANCTTFTAWDKGDQPTFDRVMRGIETLKRHLRVDFNTAHHSSSGTQTPVFRLRFTAF